MARSVFEIVGPIMIGPSSSHTAGMARIGLMAYRVLNMQPQSMHLDLSPKMKTTYSGHRSDAALFGGAIGFSESSEELKDVINIVQKMGVKTSVGFLPEGSPQNTAYLLMTDAEGVSHSITGTSVGGGSIIISAVDCVKISLAADEYHIIVWSKGKLPELEIPNTVKVQSGTREDGITVSSFSSIMKIDETLQKELETLKDLEKISVVMPVLTYGGTLPQCKKISSCEEVVKIAQESNLTISEIAIQYEMGRSGNSEEEIVELMKKQLKVIKESLKRGQEENKLLYGLASGKDGAKLMQAVNNGDTISGGIVPIAVAYALGVMEYNGSMGCIVAAPTAGSSGIVPGSMIAVQNEFGISDDKILNALFTASLMGVIIDEKGVSFSGSVGGCQGEIGVSSAITAAGLASVFTTDPVKIVHAMALCLKNLLGLVCDPIASPIEVPCIKRNAVGVANTFISADMALAGITSFIPPDEVIDALLDVEQRLPTELKSGTIGGLACTKTAKFVRACLQQ